jgi:hypothetical protein
MALLRRRATTALRPGEIEQVGGDAFLGENAGDVFCRGLFVAGGIGGVDFDELDKPVLRFQSKGYRVTDERRCLRDAQGGRLLRHLRIQIAAQESGQEQQA